ncbi:family 2 glycosyl transferase [Scytonema sp. HK-05]|uniref:glycosyltransferase family 2 protein n=1 Tax=Scytonema sp. HK-05 TaxID=1137095 RepID=UPI000936C099|nr:glycosyltransferase family 2 protein [Scytonema sp. HK-05]OKH58247.1 glycosyl transferase [Scytonema sp. HK-05]BAY48380.1 family 2 glycosyl transferase [Scytonema sp. HK-05]
MISVITPVYNGERFIESCIKVVIDQNCPDVEHIIVDGGSTDGTVKIVKQYAEKYPHIRWISEKDKGQSDAMNKGIAMANGEVLAILNVDDYYEPNVLKRISEIFKTLPEPSLLVGNCNTWDDEDNLLSVNKPAKMKLADLLLGWSINQFPANPSAYFYHTSLHQKIGLYKVGEHYAMDLDFILRAVQVANVRYVDETWGNFRYHQSSKTFQSNARGEANSVMKSIMTAYRKDLPLFQQWQIALQYDNEISERVKYYLRKIKYFLKNPLKLPLSVKGKVTKIFG